MKRFDYKTAWTTLAKPAFDLIQSYVQEAYSEVKKNAAEITQFKHALDGNDVLDVNVLPHTKCFILAHDTQALARWSHIVYFWGHWGSSNEYDDGGAYWKFSKALSQAVRDRLKRDFPYAMTKRHGIYCGVQEGMIHLYYSTGRTWLNTAVCLATPENMNLVQGYILAGGMEEAYRAHCKAIKTASDNKGMNDWLEVDKFMVEEIR